MRMLVRSVLLQRLAKRSATIQAVRGYAVAVDGAAPKTSDHSHADAHNEFDDLGQRSVEVFVREGKYGAHNYHPRPVAISKAKGKT